MKKIKSKIFSNKFMVFAFIIVILSIIFTLFFYNQLPNNIATHWNEKGIVDSYSSKNLGSFMIPLLSFILLFVLYYLPKIDPLKKNFNQFENIYYSFILVFSIFMSIIQVIIILFNLGFLIDMSLIVIILIALLMIYLGIILKRIKRNWFMGIKTPWTLSNEFIWDKTHQLASKLFILLGLIILLSLFFKNLMIYFILIPIFLIILILFIYSYFLYKDLEDKKK